MVEVVPVVVPVEVPVPVPVVVPVEVPVPVPVPVVIASQSIGPSAPITMAGRTREAYPRRSVA